MRGLILGTVLLAAGAVTGAVSGTAAATVEAPATARTALHTDFRCERVEDHMDNIAAYGCQPAPEEEITETFVVRDYGDEVYECRHGVPHSDDGLLGEWCEQIS
ncbi:hypothetical protein [Saccharothrix xinjiangensis]|uniref:Secreted protein n=1 Tax=Saccharothrix xinjiangensis TaxID=204798 RepID=A0ABV9Y6K5_9PSEU